MTFIRFHLSVIYDILLYINLLCNLLNSFLVFLKSVFSVRASKKYSCVPINDHILVMKWQNGNHATLSSPVILLLSAKIVCVCIEQEPESET